MSESPFKVIVVIFLKTSDTSVLVPWRVDRVIAEMTKYFTTVMYGASRSDCPNKLTQPTKCKFSVSIDSLNRGM